MTANWIEIFVFSCSVLGGISVNSGCFVWDSFFNYSKISSFSIIYDWEKAEYLRLNLAKKGIKIINIPVTWLNNIPEIRQFLSENIKEDSKWELSMTDKMLNTLKL